MVSHLERERKGERELQPFLGTFEVFDTKNVLGESCCGWLSSGKAIKFDLYHNAKACWKVPTHQCKYRELFACYYEFKRMYRSAQHWLYLSCTISAWSSGLWKRRNCSNRVFLQRTSNTNYYRAWAIDFMQFVIESVLNRITAWKDVRRQSLFERLLPDLESRHPFRFCCAGVRSWWRFPKR